MNRTCVVVVIMLFALGCAGPQAASADRLGNGTSGINVLALNVALPSLCVRPGEAVLINMNATNLAQKVNGCQAMLGFSSYFLSASAGCVEPGGGAWDQLIYNSWDVGSGVPGEIDTAIGVDAQGSIGTDADGTVAKITLIAGSNEGETQVVFRPDGSDVESTYFSDMTGSAVWPYKVDSQTIIIDGTAPVVSVTSPNGGEVLLGGQVHQIRWTASDAHLGDRPIRISYSPDGGSTWQVVAQDEQNDGVYDWIVPSIDSGNAVVRVTAVDCAENSGGDSSDTSFIIDTRPPSLDIASARQSRSEGPFNAPGFTYTRIISGGPRTLSGASFSPDGTKVVYIDRSEDSAWADYYIKVYDRTTDTITAIAGEMRNGTGNTGFWAYLTPYFSADGRKIGWTKAYYDTPNELQVYDIDTNTGRTYRHVHDVVPPDVANSDFLGSMTDRWVAWDYDQSTFDSDFYTYTSSAAGPFWYWQQADNLTRSATFCEYEPDSDRAGTRILHYSGRTPNEIYDTVHLLVWNGIAWVRDYGFSPIAKANWPHWSADETEIGATTYQSNPGLGRGDLSVYYPTGAFKFDLTGPAVGANYYRQSFGFNFAVGPAGAGREYLFVSNATNLYGGTDIWIARSTPEILYSYRNSSNDCATQGDVYIRLTASDAGSGLATVPSVQATDALGSPLPLVYAGTGPSGTFTYIASVTPDSANGRVTVTSTVHDRAGRVSTDTDYFDINKNQITGTISSVTLLTVSYSFSRDVTFVATNASGTPLAWWTRSVRFTNDPATQTATGSYTLPGVPEQTANLSAKGTFSLRRRQSVALDPDGQAVVDFTLTPGDLDGSNTVNTLDYSVMKGKWMSTDTTADINGDGMVQTVDYSIMKLNWYRAGDAQ